MLLLVLLAAAGYVAYDRFVRKDEDEFVPIPANDEVVLPDGTAQLPDGTVVLTDGTVIPPLPGAVFTDPIVAPENQGQYTPTSTGPFAALDGVYYTPTSAGPFVAHDGVYWPNACEHWMQQHALAKAQLAQAIASKKHNPQWKVQVQKASQTMTYARARAYEINSGACGMLLDSKG